MPRPRLLSILSTLVLALVLGASVPVSAQTINLWPGVAPGSESWTHQEQTVTDTPVGTIVTGVVTPTLTAYLPAPEKATGTAVVVAPGGAFVALAVDIEGLDVAPAGRCSTPTRRRARTSRG
jgi:hypothetical protein